MHTPRSRQRSLPRNSRHFDSTVLSTAASNLANPALSNSIPQPLCQALNALIREENPATQIEVGRHIHTAFEQSTDPTLRLRVAHVTEALHVWHVSDTKAALSFLSTLLLETIESTHTRDSAALAAALRTISSIASDPSIPNEEISRQTATLIPFIHTALFRPRPAHLGVYDSSATSATSDTSIPSRPTRVSSIRPHALSALHAVISSAPNAALPFWPLLIPTRAGIGRTAAPARRTLAFLLLYEPDNALRTAAVALTTTLVNSAKPILRHRRTHPTTSGGTFAPSSERLLSGIVVLHSVLATALQTERVRTVIPRLSRLASDVLLSVNASAVPLTERASLLSALADVLLVSTDEVDLTARAAAGSALASALSVLDPMSTHLHPEFLPTLCTRVVAALVTDWPDDSLTPVVELLCVLRSIVFLNTTLFPDCWSRLALFCQEAITVAENSICLHVARLAGTFVSNALSLATNNYDSCAGLTNKQWLEEYIPLSCEVYRHVLRYAVRHKFHAVQSTAVVALDALVQLLPADKSGDGSGFVKSTAEAIGFTATPSDTLIEIVDSLLEISSSPTSTSSVRAAAEKALGNLSVRSVGLRLSHRVLQSLRNVIVTCKSGDDTIVLAKGLAAFGNITERTAQTNGVGNSERGEGVLDLVMDVGFFALKHLRNHSMLQLHGQTASTRAAIDSSKVGAIQAAAGFLISTIFFSAEDCVCSPVWKNLEQDLRATLCESFCNNNEPVNVRCASGKAIGRVIGSSLEVVPGATDTGNLSEDLCATLAHMIGRKENARVEASAASALIGVMERGGSRFFDCVDLLGRCGQNLLWIAEQFQALGVADKSRGQYVHAQDCTTQLICVILKNRSSIQMMDDSLDEVTRAVIIEALCRFYAVPKFMTEKLVKTCHVNTLREVILESSPPVIVDDVLLPEAELSLQKILRWEQHQPEGH